MPRKKAFKVLVLGGWFVRLLKIGNNLLLIPLILSKIGAEQYGYWLASGGILAWAGACDFGVVGIIKQRCSLFLGKKDTETAVSYFQAGLLVYSILLLLMLLVVFGLSFLLQPMLDFPVVDAELYRQAFMVAGLGMSLAILKNVFSAYLHAAQRPTGDIVASVVGQLLNLALVVYLLVWTSVGLWAIPIGLLANHLSTVLVIVYYVFKETRVLHAKPTYSREIFHDYLTISPVLFFSRLGSQMTMKIEPTLIVMFLNPELATMFTVAKRLIEVLIGFANSVRGGMIAGFSHYFGEKGADATVGLLDRILQITIAISSVITVLYLSVNHAFVALWVGEEFYLGTLICVCIALDGFTTSVGNTTIQLVGALGEMRRSSLALLVESIVKVLGMLLLLPLLGVVGLPIAAFLSAAGKLYYSLGRFRQHLDGVRLAVHRPVVALLLGGLLSACAIWMNAASWMRDSWIWLLLLPALVAFLSVAYVVWAFPYVREEVVSLCAKVYGRFDAIRKKGLRTS